MLFAIAGIVVLIDQIAKAFIRHILPVGESLPLIPGVIHLTHIRNPGAAFGILPNQQVIFLIVSAAVILFILYYYRSVRSQGHLPAISLGLILGGAVGNLIDRVISGKVTDFIDLRVWPVFNIADSAIVVGVALLSIVLLSSARSEAEDRSHNSCI